VLQDALVDADSSSRTRPRNSSEASARSRRSISSPTRPTGGLPATSPLPPAAGSFPVPVQVIAHVKVALGPRTPGHATAERVRNQHSTSENSLAVASIRRRAQRVRAWRNAARAIVPQPRNGSALDLENTQALLPRCGIPARHGSSVRPPQPHPCGTARFSADSTPLSRRGLEPVIVRPRADLSERSASPVRGPSRGG